MTLNVAEIIPAERHMGMTTSEIGCEVKEVLLRELRKAEPWRVHDKAEADAKADAKEVSASIDT